MSRKPARFFAVLLLSSGIAVAEEQWPSIPSAQQSTVKCVYRLLKSKAAIQSVDVYAVDGFRSAVEYTFRDASGHTVVSDIMISGISTNGGHDITYDGQPMNGDSQKMIHEEMDFLGQISNELHSECQIMPAFDHLIPGPPEHKLWLQVELPN